MKLKQRPDDFRVEEISSVTPTTTGNYAFYRLEKRGWTTPDALAIVRRRWKIDSRRISFGGLKDRYAHTIQYLTIYDGPEHDLAHDTFTLAYVGRLPNEYTSEQIRANVFVVTLRNLSALALTRIEKALPEVAELGVPNYFDDQRFGSVNDDRSFVAKEMVLGRFEEALRLALVAPYEHDREQAKLEKAILNSHWRDWSACRAKLPPGHARDCVEFLFHRPDDFRGACARLQPDLQGMYLAAWQSHLWNRMLSRWLGERVPPDRRIAIRLKTSDVVIPRSLDTDVRAEWRNLTLPLPSARLKFDPQAPWSAIVSAVMDEEGIPLHEMRIKGMRQPFFSKGDRIARVPVTNLFWSTRGDELNHGQQAIELKFELPRGCYATMIVKRLTATNS